MRVEDLERELRADRPTAEPDFTRRLDEWAAEGFPRDRGLGPRSGGGRGGALRDLWERVVALPPRRVLLPTGAVATVVVIAGAAISQVDWSDTDQGLSDTSGSANEKPVQGAAGQGLQLDSAPPEAAGSAGGGAAASEYDQANLPAADDAFSLKPSAGVARGTDDRLVDATAQLTLGADADDVQGVANDVVAVTDRFNGVVLDSRVSRERDAATASFELEIPYRQLNAALDELSGLADVVSRTEAGHDITQRAVRARKRLGGTLDQIAKARVELIRADTREERLVIKARIGSLQAQADALESELNGVKRQARFATVNVEVTSKGAGASGSGDDGGDWSLGDAVDDAGHVLEVIGGIALVSLAVLVPLTLVASLAWLAASTARRRGRERALDAQSS